MRVLEQAGLTLMQGVDRFVRESKQLWQDAQDWAMDLTGAERVVLMSALALALLFVVVRRPQGVRGSGSMGRTFAYTVFVGLIVGSLATWMSGSLFNLPTIE